MRYYTNVGFRGLTICQLIFLRYYEPRRLMLRQLNRTSLVNKGFITWQEYCTRELPLNSRNLLCFSLFDDEVATLLWQTAGKRFACSNLTFPEVRKDVNCLRNESGYWCVSGFNHAIFLVSGCQLHYAQFQNGPNEYYDNICLVSPLIAALRSMILP